MLNNQRKGKHGWETSFSNVIGSDGSERFNGDADHEAISKEEETVSDAAVADAADR